MSKETINYAETSIYKIFCKDESISDVYVGHTTNFSLRKYQHKNACNNSLDNIKIYKTIRDNGGWNNWKMVEIAKYICNDSTEARIKEQEHYEQLQATLNSHSPYINKELFFCSICNLQCHNKKRYEQHINCKIHKNKSLSKIEIESKVSLEDNKLLKEKPFYKYYCQYCDFKCYQKCDWERHIVRPKHISNKEVNSVEIKKPEKNLLCDCGTEYKTSSGLWKHRKKCNFQDDSTINKNNEYIFKDLNKTEKNTLLINILKQNMDFHNKIMEWITSETINNNNNNISNNNNNNS